MVSNIAIDPESGRPYIQEGANDATLVEDPDGRGAYLLRGGAGTEVDHNDIYRSVDGGASWELVASDLPLNATVTDPECLVGAPTLYRVEAWTLLPSSSATTVELDAQPNRSIYLSGGDGYDTVARLHYKPTTTINPGLVDQEEHYFSGQTDPTVYEGDATSVIIQASAILLPTRVAPEGGGTTSVGNTLLGLATMPGVKLFRDGRGRRIYGRLYNVQVDEQTDETGSASFTIKRTTR